MLNTSISINDAFSKPLLSIQNSLNKTIDTFEKLNSTISAPALTTPLDDLGKKIDDSSLKNKKLGETISGNSGKQGKFNNQIKDQNNLLENTKVILKGMAGLWGFRQITNGFRQGFEDFKSIESNANRMNFLLKANTEQAEILANRVKEVSANWFNPDEVSRAMIDLGKGGFSQLEVWESIPAVTNMAIASEMDLGRATEFAIDSLRGFNLEASEMARMVDVMAYGADLSTIGVDSLGETFAVASKQANIFGASLEETTVLAGLMASAVKGSQAGRMINIGFKRMANPTDDAEAWLKHMKVQFVDPATGEFNKLSDTIGAMHEAMKGLTDQQKLVMAQDVFGEGAKGWLAVLEQPADTMANWLLDIEENSVGYAEKLGEVMSNTTEGILRSHSSQMKTIWGDFYKSLSDGGMGGALDSLLEFTRGTMRVALGMAHGVFMAVGTALGFISRNADVLIPILGTLALSYAILNAEKLTNIGLTLKQNLADAIATGQIILYNIQAGLSAVATLLLASAKFVLILATQGLTSAMQFLSMTMLATPWGLVVLGVLAIISILAVAVKVVNHFAGTSYSAMGIVVGAVYWAGALIYNIFAGLMNGIISMGINVWNGISTFANALANVFIDPIGSIKRMFFGLGEYVLGVLSSIAKVIDTIFGSNLTDAVGKWQNGLDKKVNSLGEQKIQVMQKLDAKDYEIKRKDLTDAFNKGNLKGTEWQNNISNYISGALDSSLDPSLLDGGVDSLLESQLGDMLGDLGDIKDSNKKIKDNTDKDKNLQFLLDFATQRAIGRAVYLNVEVNNENNIDSEMDIDGVVSKITEGITEQVIVAVEGDL